MYTKVCFLTNSLPCSLQYRYPQDYAHIILAQNTKVEKISHDLEYVKHAW